MMVDYALAYFASLFLGVCMLIVVSPRARASFLRGE